MTPPATIAYGTNAEVPPPESILSPVSFGTSGVLEGSAVRVVRPPVVLSSLMRASLAGSGSATWPSESDEKRSSSKRLIGDPDACGDDECSLTRRRARP